MEAVNSVDEVHYEVVHDEVVHGEVVHDEMVHDHALLYKEVHDKHHDGVHAFCLLVTLQQSSCSYLLVVTNYNTLFFSVLLNPFIVVFKRLFQLFIEIYHSSVRIIAKCFFLY